MNEITLSSIFESNKEELAKKLDSYSLPRDSRKVHDTVTTFLNNMFENDGTYRQSLTQSEDYILQSAIQLVQAQQSIAQEIASMASGFNAQPQTITAPDVNPYIHIAGTGVGAAAGTLLGPWGIVCGAIAGTAISIYLSVRSKNYDSDTPAHNRVRTINVNAFINIVKKICESIDNLMETYRVQVRRIENALNSKEEVTLQNSFSSLLDQIANMLNAVTGAGDSVSAKVKKAAEMLSESLENYDLTYSNGKIVRDK